MLQPHPPPPKAQQKQASPYSFAGWKQPRRTGGGRRTCTDLDLETGVNALEMRAIRAAEVPGPGAYPGAVATPPIKGGRFNESQAKSGLEWELYRAAQLPGPASYPTPQLPLPQGGKFSVGTPKSDTEWQVCTFVRLLPRSLSLYIYIQESDQ
eukprot:SAG31_NODE_943_length_10852_cov_22.874454_6_plen_153_part_00